MTVPPDQFQRRVRVRLPIADRYLSGEGGAKAARQDLDRCFRTPRLQVTITPEGLVRKPSPSSGGPSGDGAQCTRQS